MGHGHGHDHAAGTAEASVRTLALVAGLNLVGFALEAAGGFAFGSVAVLADAAHMLFDVVAYAMAAAAAYAVARTERSERWTYGFHRLEPVSGFLNGLLLFPTIGFVVFESLDRLSNPTAIDAGPTIAVAAFGLGVNLLSVAVLRRRTGGDAGLNERGAFYHLLGDTGASVAVIVSTAVVATTGIRAVDPVVAVLVALLVLYSAVELLAGGAAILLQRSPVSAGEVRAAVEGVAGVAGVEDVHVWQVCSHVTVASLHLREHADTLAESHAVRRRVHERLADLGVTHATVEPVADDERLAAHDHRATI